MRDIALTVFVFALLPVCLVRPWIGILAWYWLGLMNPHRLTWSFATHFQFAMLIGAATLIGVLTAKDRKPIPWNRELGLIAALMAYFTFTTLSAWAPEYAWPQWEKVAKIILMTFVATMMIHGRERLHWLLLISVISVGFYGFKGGIFTFTTGGVHRVEGPEGTFLSGNTFLGLALTMILPLILSMARQTENIWLRRLLFATFGLTVVSVIFTYSRGALLGLAAVLPLLYFKSNKKFLLVFLLIPLGFFGKDLIPEGLYKRAETIKTYEEDRSAMQRIQSWTVAWNVAKDYPLTGAGFEFELSPNDKRWFGYGNPDTASYLRSSSAAHSIYFQVLGQHGYVALILFLALLISTQFTLRDIAIRAEREERTRWIAAHANAIRIGLIGYMVSGAFLSVAYFDLMYLYVALTALFARELGQTVTASPTDDEQTKQRERRLRSFDPPAPQHADAGADNVRAWPHPSE
jgi:probable O-glycosylation ligase (exosortase A-associated)